MVSLFLVVFLGSHPILVSPVKLKDISEWFDTFYVNFVEFRDEGKRRLEVLLV